MTAIAAFVDALTILLAAFGAWLWIAPYPAEVAYYGLLVSMVVLSAFPVLSMTGLYQSFRAQTFIAWASRVSFAWLVLTLIVLVGLWALKISEDYSRLWLGVWLVASWAMALLWRAIGYRLLSLMRAKGHNSKPLVIIGAGKLGQQVASVVDQERWAGYELVAFFDDDPMKQTQHINGKPVYDTTHLADWLKDNRVDEVWFALPLRAEDRLLSLLHALRHATVNIRYIPNLSSLRLLNHAPRQVLGFSMLDLSVSPMTEPLNRLLKGVEDRLLAMVIIIGISPILLMIALAIKLTSPGPILFKQTRLGMDGKPFNVWKFRSMVVHEEAPGKVTQARLSDHRITPLGKWLRRTSLDELPQFFNVLMGDMSIVGPRPHAVAHNDFYKEQIDSYMRRHKVKPGITGWAQVNGWRGETDTLEKMQKRIDCDLWYIEHWSLWLDIKIVLMTLFKGFVHANAR